MKFFYIENIRLPTEKAHGYQIMKTCEAIARSGVDVELVVTDRKTSDVDPFVAYGISTRFPIRRLHVIDALSGAPKFFWKAAFLIERWTFNRSVSTFVSQIPKDAVCYTRDTPIALAIKARRPDVSVFVEFHVMPKSSLVPQLEKIDGVVSLTSSMQKRTLDVLPQQKTIVIPDAVDMDVFDPSVSREEARRNLGIPGDAQIVVYGGRFTTMEQAKGLGMLDEAIAHLSPTNANLRLFLVGGTAEQFLQVEKRNAAPSTVCVPSVDRKTLALYYRAADVLAMPFPNTPHYAHEMSPLKMFEYMASGTPMVTADLPSVRDVLSETTAVFYEPDNAKDLEEKIRFIFFQDIDTRRQMGEKAQREVQLKYTWSERAHQIVEFIHQAGKKSL